MESDGHPKFFIQKEFLLVDGEGINTVFFSKEIHSQSNLLVTYALLINATQFNSKQCFSRKVFLILRTPFSTLKCTTTTHYGLNNKHKVVDKVDSANKNLKCVSFVKVKFMAELLHWIALDCADVPNKILCECVFDTHCEGNIYLILIKQNNMSELFPQRKKKWSLHVAFMTWWCIINQLPIISTGYIVNFIRSDI